jgi:hypothetical protein
MHLVRMTTKPLANRSGPNRSSGGRQSRRSQRCAVRVTYTRNKIRGQWAAHGRYIVRDTATALRQEGVPAFGSVSDGSDVPALLGSWQKARDQRLFKLIRSPEFGDRLDLERLTRDVMANMESDLGLSLEWAAVVHRNTDHPHVHVALRGVAGGEPLRINRDYIRHGIRRNAENGCTFQLGYRTSLDVEESERREVSQARFTSLDRILAREMSAEAAGVSAFEVTRFPDRPGISELAQSREQRLVARLNHLSEMRLAEPTGPFTWRVRHDFESALRTFQKAQDRQKMLGQHAAFLSDPRLQYRVVQPSSSAEIDGRVIAHVLDDVSDQPHVLIEGVDGVVYYLPHDSAIATARANLKLKPNAFVHIRSANVNGDVIHTVEDLGDANEIVSNSGHLQAALRRLVPRGTLDEAGQSWSGWLGRYQSALRAERVKSPHTPATTRARRRENDRTL